MKNHPSACTDFSDNQISALIHLLSDQDPKIAQTIHDQLVAVGQPAMPLLEQAQGDTDNSFMAGRISAVISDIKLTKVEQSFKALIQSREPLDLETGAFLIARASYPDLDIQSYRGQIDNIVEVLKQRWDSDISPRKAIQSMNEYLFHDLRFKGNTQDYYDPDNSFLHKVLERRVGIPISLSVLYLLIGQRLNVPVVGLGLPGHFMVGLRSENVFIDCFNQGIVLSQHDVTKFLKDYGVEFEQRHLVPTPNEQIIARMIRNLVAIYHKRNEVGQAQRFTRLLALIEPDDGVPEQE